MLGSNFWRLLSDLYYCAYLVHFLIIRWYFSQTRTGYVINSRELIITSLAIFIFSYVIALPFAFLVELPSRNMIGLILFTMHKVRHGESEEEEDEVQEDRDKRSKSTSRDLFYQTKNSYFLNSNSSSNLGIRDATEHVGSSEQKNGKTYCINESENLDYASSVVTEQKRI